jgi:hypothetical protein
MALGVQAVGLVTAAGRAVSDWAPGDAVMTHLVPLRDQGTWAPRLIAPPRPGCSPGNRRVPAARPRLPSRCPRSPPSRCSATGSTSAPVSSSWSTEPAESPADCSSLWPSRSPASTSARTEQGCRRAAGNDRATQARRRAAAQPAPSGTTIIPASPRVATAHPPARQPDVALVTASAASQHRCTDCSSRCQRCRLHAIATPS